MKAHGKGVGISINSEFISTLNNFKQAFNSTPPAPVREFKQLVVKPHPRQAEMEAFRAIPSWKP